jgi:nitrite reductase/ring-hydroxylating ferredoxin subunit
VFAGVVVRSRRAAVRLCRQLPARRLATGGTERRFLTRENDLILCGGHGALFRIEDGVCVAGPCPGQSLAPWPVRIEQGDIVVG